MASFVIYDQENQVNANNRAKDNNTTKKRSVLGILNSNTEAKFNEVKKGLKSNNLHLTNNTNNDVNKSNKPTVNIKNKNVVKPFVDNDIQPVQKAVIDFKIFDETTDEDVNNKHGNKLRVLKDKQIVSCELQQQQQPSCSKHVTTLPSDPWRLLGSEPMSEYEDISQGSPMCLDKSLTGDINNKNTQLDNERLFACEEYREDILQYLRQLELERKPSKYYMLKQTDISYPMRAILVEWLVEVAEEYHLTTETLYLAISYIDRFLSCMNVVRVKLQLVGTAAMFIASKFEEIYPPDVKDFVYITDDTYPKKDVLKTEHLMLKVLGFDLSTPTPYAFLNNFTTGYPVVDEVKYLAQYLMELTLLEADPYLGFLPSQIAASALLIAKYTIQPTRTILTKKLQQVLDYHLEDLLPCLSSIDKTFRNAEKNPQQAIREKYKSEKYHSVGLLTPLNEDCSQVIKESNTKDEDDD